MIDDLLLNKRGYFIYLYRNKINGKVYVGRTDRTLRVRHKQHISNSKKSKKGFDAAIKKYGIENFEFILLEEVETSQEMFIAEIKWIEHYKSYIKKYGRKYGYNLTAGGEGGNGDYGELSHNAYLTNEDAKKIREMYKTDKYSQSELAEIFNTGKQTIGRIIRNERFIDNNYIYAPRDLSSDNPYKSKFTLEEADIIRQEYGNGKNYKELANMYNASATLIAEIIRNKIYQNPNTTIQPKRPEEYFCKFIDKEILEIRNMYATGQYSQKKLSNKFNIGQSSIYQIIANKTYKDDNYNYQPRKINRKGENNINAKITYETAEEIRKLYLTGNYTQKKLSQMFKLSKNTIYRLINNLTYVV